MCTQEQAHLHVVEQLKNLVYMYMYVSVLKYHIFMRIYLDMHMSTNSFSATLYVVHLHLIQYIHVCTCRDAHDTVSEVVVSI